jgi:cytochrome c55X
VSALAAIRGRKWQSAISLNEVKHLRYLFFVAPLLATPAIATSELPVERQRELIRMVRQDCGSCHGMTLNGGLGPALSAKALKERDVPKEALVATIVGGRPGTPMPPWHRFLTEPEAEWIVDRLIEGFPE